MIFDNNAQVSALDTNCCLIYASLKQWDMKTTNKILKKKWVSTTKFLFYINYLLCKTVRFCQRLTISIVTCEIRTVP